MIALVGLVAIVVVVIMACNQTPIVGGVIHDDPEVPVPFPHAPQEPIGVLDLPPGPPQYAEDPFGLSDVPIVVAQTPGFVPPLNPDYHPFVDPANPIEPPSDVGAIGDAPPALEDPWAMNPVYVPSNPSMPVKIDPVVPLPPVYNDPELPVPIRAEQIDAAITPPWYQVIDSPPVYDPQYPDYTLPVVDPSLPLPVVQSDPQEFSDPPPIELAPDVNPIENWTAEDTADTYCPPSVEIEYDGGAMIESAGGELA